MDLQKAIGLLASEFKERGINCALIGGYALGAYGVGRATLDLDLLVDAGSLPELDKAMTSLGYEKVFSSENVSQFVSRSAELGEVDFIHAFRPAARKMLQRAVLMPGLPPGQEMKVLRPEDIIGLKAQAIANNPGRKHQDSADIEELLRSTQVDWSAVQEYLELFGMGATASSKLNMAENKDQFFSASITEDMDRMLANRRRLEAARTPAERLEFINGYNKFMRHRRREFRPITGDNFKL